MKSVQLFACLLGVILAEIEATVVFVKTPDSKDYAQVGQDHKITYNYTIDNAEIVGFAKLKLYVVNEDGTNSSLITVDKDGSNLSVGSDLSSAMSNLASRGSVQGGGNLNETVTWKFTGITRNDDAVLFLCVSFQTGILACSETFQMTSAVFPSFLLEKEIIKEGNTVDITCQADGKPKPVVSWVRLKDGHQHSNGSSQSSLQFASVSRNDVGVYACKALNPLGEIQSKIELVIHFVDYDKEKTLEEIYTFRGANTSLHCEPLGFPPPSITWTLPNGDTSPKNDTVLFVKATDFDKPYKCTISNAVGTKVVEILLKNYGIPSLSCKKYSVTVSFGSKLAEEETTQYILYYKESGDSTWKETSKPYIMKTTAEFDLSSSVDGDYEIKVKARNKMGESPESSTKTCSGCYRIDAHQDFTVLLLVLGKMLMMILEAP